MEYTLFNTIEQFKDQVQDYKGTNKDISFEFNNKNINKELKFIFYNKLFLEEWSLRFIFMDINLNLNRLTKFINEKYPNVNSLIQLDLEKVNIQWMDWLDNYNIKLTTIDNYHSRLNRKPILVKNFISKIFKKYNVFFKNNR